MINDKVLEFGMKLQSYLSTMYNSEIILAGGAVRDTILGKEVSDWDFYVEKDILYEVANYAEEHFSGPFRRIFTHEHDFYGDGFAVVTLSFSLEGKPIQIIGVDNIHTLMNTFSFPISRAYIRFATGEVRTTIGFEIARKEQIHIIKEKFIHGPNFERYASKILSKYPWEIQIV